MQTKPFVHHHTKVDGRSLWLYSLEPRDYEFTNDLPPLDTKSIPFRRWHPLRQEYVFYNAGRNTRTLNPPPEYNPLAPVAKDGYPGEIPVEDFEIAVFDNRWPGLAQINNPIAPQTGQKKPDQPSYGKCEVVVYSTRDKGSLADFSVEHIAMLLKVWGMRHQNLLEDRRISYVMPFENRGEGVGVTLPHPHGQIYAFEETPEIILRQCKSNVQSLIFEQLRRKPNHSLLVDENEAASVQVPAYARYPFESWFLPKRHIATPLDMAEQEILDFAKLLKSHVARLDNLLGEPLDYVMWVSLPPRGFEDSWPFHLQFWPMKRGPGKMKFLASVEQITQQFLVDVTPEESANALRQASL